MFGGPGKPKRRILFIERAFQLRFILKVVAIIVLGTALTGGLLYLLANREFGRAFYSAHYQARSSWELLLPAVLASSFLSMCLVAAVAVVLTLYDSHRIGGPLYRFKLNLEAVGKGDLTLVTRLREHDELQSLTGAMNQLTEGLRAKVVAIREAEEAEAAALADLLGALGGGGRPTPEQVARLEGAHGALQKTLGAFRIDG